MIKQLKSRKSVRLYIKLVSLLVTASVLVSSSSAAIALDTYRAARALVMQTFTLAPEDGVTVTLSGMMPAGGSAEAEPAEAKGEGVLHAYDITIRYPDGAEFEPEEGEPISVSFESAAIAEAIADNTTVLTVEHIAGSGEIEKLDLVLAEDDKAEFRAESFSVYIIRDNDQSDVTTPRKTFWFLDSHWREYEESSDDDPDGDPEDPDPLSGGYYVSGAYFFPNTAGDMVCTQTVKAGEKLHPIVLPENFDWGSFYGWYIVTLDLAKSQAATAAAMEAETHQAVDPATIARNELTQFVYKWDDAPTLITSDTEIEVTEDADVYLAPHYSKYRFVNFHEHEREGHESSNIVARKLLVLGNNHSDTIDISDVTANSPDPQSKVFFGWKYGTRTYQTRRATGDIIPQSITVAREELGDNDSVDLYAVFKDARWIYFVHGESGWGAQYVGAMFAYLYDETISPEERVYITQLPSTTRPGYIFDGWYTGHLDQEGHIVYEQQVSMPLVDETVTGNSSVITTEGQTVNVGTNGTYIHMGKLYLKEELTLYAKWRPVNSADYKVVIWKQQVTNSKNATDAQKTYDYYDYILMEDQTTGSVVLDTKAYQDLYCEDLKNSPNQEIRDAFVGFHYSRTEVVVQGTAYNGDIPSERVEGVVDPDGSTVVNVYYDRDLMAVNFYYTSSFTSNLPAGVKDDTYRYTTGAPTDNPLYGIVNDDYVQLDMSSTPNEYYVFRYEYIPSAEDDFGDNQYGIVNNEYVPLDRTVTYKWMKSGRWYEKISSPNTNQRYTGIASGRFVEVYRSGSRWYYSYNNRTYNYSTSYPFYTERTNGATGEYDGARYVLNNNSVRANTSDDPALQYGQDGSGNLYELNRAEDAVVYSYNGTPYTVPRFERTEYRRTRYDGTLYIKSGGSFVEAPANATGTLYGRRSADAPFEEVVKETKTIYTYTLHGTDTKYEGSLYTRTNYSGYPNYYKKRLTWTGLYEQTFAQNGYNWDVVKSIIWNDGTNGQTLLDGFIQTDNPYNLESSANNASYQIRHYKQKLDGSYDRDSYVLAHYNKSSGTFNFTNKFYGFSVAAYSVGENGFSPTGSGDGVEEKTDGTSASVTFPLHVYHTRNKRKITLVDYRTENNSPGQPKDEDVENIPYEAPINTYMADYMDPPKRANYNFGGWYVDKSFTKRADIEHMTMPAENMIFYAKWDLKYYFVEIDPNGGEMEDGLEFAAYTGVTTPRKQSTYTWLRYGQKLSEYANVERTYVPDNIHGTYVYVNVKFAPTFEQAVEKDWNYCLESKYRAAFYCLESELESIYNAHFKDLRYNGEQLISWEDFQSYCVDTTHKYRKADGVEGYVLAAWYKVNDDGTTSNEIYNFNDIVTKPTRIRAVWRKTGEYYIEYNPYMRRYNIGEYVNKNGEIYHNPTHYDPFDPDDPSQITDKYLDSTEVVIRTSPEHIPERYVFKGWQLLEPDGTLAEGKIYSPLEMFRIESEYADHDGVIHFEACYEPEQESTRRVEVTKLILDANGGTVRKNGLDIYEEANIYVDLSQNQVVFKKQPNNFEVDLEDYYDNFLHEDGYILIGWSRVQHPDHYIPDFHANATIGVDCDEEELPNKLYAVWEPMYYLTLENHSTEFDVTFDLRFIGNGDDNMGYVFCYGEGDDMSDPYKRHLFSDSHEHDDITVVKHEPNYFTVTLKKAETVDGVVKPTKETLVLPEGVDATYTVSGSIVDALNAEGKALNKYASELDIYNSGDGSEKLASYGAPDNQGIFSYKNIDGTTTTDYSVSGRMKLGAMGQKVAFYTGDPSPTAVYIAANFYDPVNDEWVRENSENSGPGAVLSFDTVLLDSPSYVSSDGEQGITGLSVIQGAGKTFGIKQQYTNTAYKFIGWYDDYKAAPSDIPIDGEGARPNSTITGLTVPNEHYRMYYALYVPLADGTLTIRHDEKSTSIGYPKQMLVRADYTDAGGQAAHEEQLVTTEIYSIESRTGKVQTQITVPVRESDSNNDITITLGAMSGYGCVYSNTYFGSDMLSKEVSSYVPGGVVAVVYYDPTQTRYLAAGETVDDLGDIGSGETKHLYKHVLTKKVGDLFEDSETVKGYKVLRDLHYFSDFERKYEFIYSYYYRDSTTLRKYCAEGSTAVYTSDADFMDFVAKSAPYITNFGEDLKWNYSSIDITNLKDKGRIIATMSAVQTPKKARVNVMTQGSAISVPRQVDIGSAFPEGEMPTAEKIRNGMQFYRWRIENAVSKKLIGYCYWHEFTFQVWEDITITAEYVKLADDGEYHRYYPDDENEAYVTIQHLDSTRNRWVRLDGEGNIVRTEKDMPEQYYDKLIDDFSILYIDHGRRINTSPDQYKVGMIYEIVGEIEDESIPEAYEPHPDDALRLTAINYVISKNKMNGILNSAGKPRFYYNLFDPSTLTHDNRIEFFRGIDNLKEGDVLNPNAKYVFNVYAFMKTPEGDIIQSAPVTMQLYRLAVKDTAN